MFDDRLVFETPGKFPGMVKAENIRHTHFSRNPKIAQFLKAYKYVKEFGEGIDRIFREQEANDADAPTFVMNEFILASTVRKSSKVTEIVGSDVTSLSPVVSPVMSPVQLTERQIKIYKLVKENPQISTSEMSPVLSVGIRTIKRDIIDMQKKGVVTREGNTSAGKWVLLMEI